MPNLPWEDSLLERKLQSDLKDLPKTLVAFANSVRPGHIAEILIGEKDDGAVQGVSDADQIQKTIRKECEKLYPPIIWRSTVYEKVGLPCVRVEIEYSGETPHFGGPAWVRQGSETIRASDELFQKLIELRLGKVRELAMWLDKEITVEPDIATLEDYRYGSYVKHPRWGIQPQRATLQFVNSFWATFHADSKRKTEPLEKLVLSWDDDKNSLKVLIKP